MKRKITVNIEPSRKIDLSLRLMLNSWWGLKIIGMMSQAGNLNDSAIPRQFDAVLIANLRVLLPTTSVFFCWVLEP